MDDDFDSLYQTTNELLRLSSDEPLRMYFAMTGWGTGGLTRLLLRFLIYPLFLRKKVLGFCAEARVIQQTTKGCGKPHELACLTSQFWASFQQKPGAFGQLYTQFDERRRVLLDEIQKDHLTMICSSCLPDEDIVNGSNETMGLLCLK